MKNEDATNMMNYHHEAAANLSQWRTGLFKQVFTTYKQQSILEAGHGVRLLQGAEPHGHDRYSLFKPSISCPPGTSLSRYGGEADGGKWLCDFVSLKAPCTIFSLGSRGDYSFEEAMLEATECDVHTFDCTLPGRSLGPRHHYHERCIGKSSDNNFVTLDEAVAMVGASALDLLKMDIEEFEYDVFADWTLNTKSLPQQLSFELHYTDMYAGTPYHKNMSSQEQLVWPGVDEITLSQLAILFMHLANLGYGIISQEPNPMCGSCSEFTMLSVDHPHRHGKHSECRRFM
jgi:hypothetical protein